MLSAPALCVALLVDALLGWPAPIFARIGHPVTWLGRLISFLDGRLNDPAHPPRRRRLMGLLSALAVIAAAALPAWALALALPDGIGGTILTGLLAWPLLASRSLYDHVAAVARPLRDGDVPAARRAVAMIVGRDPATLDAHGVARAGLESLAENTSDGVVAPLFWGVIFGLPGIAAYKAINTLDSMIGHRTPRHEDFGRAAARIDDAANLLPARLTGLIFALASGRPAASVGAMRRDARRHRSPNAGWPEAAMAGALGIRLSGPRRYGDRIADEPWLNGTAPDPGAQSLSDGLALYRRGMVLLGATIALLAVF